ncbi:transcriptional regulator [Alsobacter metallidurans]|uniref:Transcriptional regulator n=2 Tax=Alsobacter metallidurans TaxID=340221 RepID=A0A917I413_9HYPH|nr:transcriptional regulator [Alsobacter metallidurans]
MTDDSDPQFTGVLQSPPGTALSFERASENATAMLDIEPMKPELTFKKRAYTALKKAITGMDPYSSPEPVWLDERQLSEQLGVSRTPVREAIAMLEHEGFVRSVPRRGIVVVRKSLREIVEAIEAWAALESMAARLAAHHASMVDIRGLRTLFESFGEQHPPAAFVSEYSAANIAFHQRLIELGGSELLVDLTANLLLHVRGIRQLSIGKSERIARSFDEHLGIIDALERRDADLAERLSKEHTLGLAAYVEKHGKELLGDGPVRPGRF